MRCRHHASTGEAEPLKFLMRVRRRWKKEIHVSTMKPHCKLCVGACVYALLGVAAAAQTPAPSSPPSARLCRIDGRISSGGTPLPGVSVVVNVDGVSKAVTSTDGQGQYSILVTPEATYQL